MWNSVATAYRQRLREIAALAWTEEGVTSIEYALIASLIAIVIVGSVTNVGTAVMDLFDMVAEKVADLM